MTPAQLGAHRDREQERQRLLDLITDDITDITLAVMKEMRHRESA
jgi:hypothetical protein